MAQKQIPPSFNPTWTQKSEKRNKTANYWIHPNKKKGTGSSAMKLSIAYLIWKMGYWIECPEAVKKSTLII